MPFKKREVLVPSSPSSDEVILRRGLCVGIFSEPTGDDGVVDLASPDNRVALPPHLRCADVLHHFGWIPVQNGIEVTRLVGMDGYLVRLTRQGECRIVFHRFLPSRLIDKVFGERRQ